MSCTLCGAPGVNISTCPSNPLSKKPTEGGHAPIMFPDMTDVIDAAHGVYSAYHRVSDSPMDVSIPVIVKGLAEPLIFNVSYDDEFYHAKKSYLAITITISAETFRRSYAGITGTCWRIKWYPDLCLVRADGLLFGKSREGRVRIDPKVCFSGQEISGRWLMEIRDKLSQNLGARAIIMGDETILYYNEDEYIDMRPLYVQKHGMTYYMQFGYIPLMADSIDEVLEMVIEGKKLLPANTTELFSSVKSKPALIKGQQKEWQTRMNEFSARFPHVYIKLYGDGDINGCKGTYKARSKVTVLSAPKAQSQKPSNSSIIQKLTQMTDAELRALMQAYSLTMPLTAATRSMVIKKLTGMLM